MTFPRFDPGSGFPDFPEPSSPDGTPSAAGLDGPLRDLLIEQRKVMVSGALDADTIGDLSAQLMTLDGLSSGDVDLVINSPGGPLPDVFAVVDVIGLMRAKVNVTVVGLAAGTAVAVVANGSGERRAAGRAKLSLRIDSSHTLAGTAAEIGDQAEELGRLRSRYVDLLVSATGLDKDEVGSEIERGGWHDAGTAASMGIVDPVDGPPEFGSS